MKYKVTITDENGNEHLYNVSRSSSDEPKNLNDFILEALSISEDKRELPFMIQCPNGLEVHPSLKMKFENYGSSYLVISWKLFTLHGVIELRLKVGCICSTLTINFKF